MKKTIYVLFGITGDLAKRKLIPSFYHLDKNNKISEDFEVIGIGRKPIEKQDFENNIENYLKEFGNIKKSEIKKEFTSKFSYQQIDFTNLDDYKNLKEIIDKKSKSKSTQVIYYLAMPPSLFKPILENIGNSGLNDQSNSIKKIAFEKPFGNNLDSAKELNNSIMKVFKEEQVYRIDHYLGKDAVQNFLVLRFANHLLEPLWNNRHIDNIQITASEKLGVENRASYYDSSGALKDMVQNHLFQMLSLIAMEPPVTLEPEKIRDEKSKVFSSIKDFDGEWDKNVVFGQYKNYLSEPKIPKKSRTETYVALKVEIENWRWSGVPFYLRTGKKLKEKGTTIVIEFKKLPNLLFNKKGDLESNKLVIKIQPNEKIEMQLNVKSPDSKLKINPVFTQFDQKDFFGIGSPEAYQKILSDIELGDQTLFTRWDGVKKSWEIVDKLVGCKDNCPIVFKYECGSYGPIQADKLLEKDNRYWHNF